MTGWSSGLDELKRHRRALNNVAREGMKTVSLKCGCEVTGIPVTVYPGGRRTFRCAEHGLQDAKR